MERKKNNLYLKIDWEQESDREVFSFAKKIKFSEMRTLHFENLKEQKNLRDTELPAHWLTKQIEHICLWC